uniref:Uncharacterized protein n=1 Tax=Sphaerodactylus townsendi TaxID=933632 RepID=A0ACB8EAY4_9SAUR
MEPKTKVDDPKEDSFKRVACSVGVLVSESARLFLGNRVTAETSKNKVDARLSKAPEDTASEAEGRRAGSVGLWPGVGQPASAGALERMSGPSQGLAACRCGAQSHHLCHLSQGLAPAPALTQDAWAGCLVSHPRRTKMPGTVAWMVLPVPPITTAGAPDLGVACLWCFAQLSTLPACALQVLSPPGVPPAEGMLWVLFEPEQQSALVRLMEDRQTAAWSLDSPFRWLPLKDGRGQGGSPEPFLLCRSPGSVGRNLPSDWGLEKKRRASWVQSDARQAEAFGQPAGLF